MIDVLIIGGFSGYSQEQSYAVESPFLLYKDGIFCDAPGLYKIFVNSKINYNETEIESPPFVCYVLKQLLRNKGFSSEMIFYLDQEKDRMTKLFSEPYRLILLSTTLLTSKEQVNAAVKIIKSFTPQSIIVCGGILIDRSLQIKNRYINEKDNTYEPCKRDYFFLEDYFEDSCSIDLFVFSDPELSVTSSIIQKFKNGKRVQDFISFLPNIAVFDNKKWHFSSEIKQNDPILPEIDWSIFREDEIRMAVPMVYSKGCPNRCSFCNFQSISKYQEKKLNVLNNEIEIMLKHHSKPGFIVFCDDNICGNRNSIYRLTEFLIEKKFPIKWSSFFDARFIDDALSEKLKLSGCNWLKIGMESADDNILGNMRKPCRKKHYTRAVNSLVNYDISIDCYFIIGFPGETKDTIKNTIEMINSFKIPKCSVNQFMFFPFVFIPLSPIYEKKDREKYDISGYMLEWQHNTMDNKTASAAIPGIVKQITTMNPQHGNIEKMIVKNGRLLADIDKARGDLIRNRLKTGKEDKYHWKKLERLTENLKLDKTERDGFIRFV